MSKVLRTLGIWLCKPIYKAIPKIYSIFYYLANARFFQDDTIKNLSGNIYVLISVVMLFTFSASLLSAIVNPDLMADKKKGFGAVVKRSFIGIFLIVLIPFAFDEAYKIQESIMDNSLIERTLVGIDYSTTSENGEEIKGGNGGQVIAGSLISSVLYPVKDEVAVEDENLGEAYEKMVKEDIGEIKYVAKHINDAPSEDIEDEDYAFEFEGLTALIAGGITVYLLLLFAMDTAVRMFKLAFLELTAPISIVAYIAAGDDSLKKWTSEIGKTYFEVFIRVAGMAFYIFMISHMDSFIDDLLKDTNVEWELLLKVIIIVGLLIFVKQIPDFVSKAFGIEWKSKGGIGGRLGSMAGVGETAKKAWGTIRKGLTNAGMTIAGAPLLGAGLAVRHGWNKGFGGRAAWKDTGVGKGLRTVGTALKAGGSYLAAGNPVKGLGAFGKTLEDSEIGKQHATEREQKLALKRWNNFMSSINQGGAFDENDQIVDSLKARNNILSAISSSRMSRVQQDNITELLKAKSVKASYDTIDSSKKAISDKLSELYNNTTDDDLKKRLQDFQSAFNLGNMSTAEFKSQLDNLVASGKISTGSANNLAFNLDKINNTIETAGLSEIFVEDGKLKVSKTTQEIAKQEATIARAQAKYDKSKETATSSIQELMENFVSMSERVDKKVSYQQAQNKSESNPYGGNHNMKSDYKVQI